MKKSTLPWFKLHSDDWHDGTRDLTIEERGVYFDVINALMIFGTPLLKEDQWWGHRIGISPRLWRSIRDRLKGRGKLAVGPEGVSNARAERVWREREQQRETKSQNARSAGELAPKASQKLGEVGASSMRAPPETGQKSLNFSGSEQAAAQRKSDNREGEREGEEESDLDHPPPSPLTPHPRAMIVGARWVAASRALRLATSGAKPSHRRAPRRCGQ